MEYSAIVGICDVPSVSSNTELKTQILTAFAMLGDEAPGSPTDSVDNAADTEFIRIRNCVATRDCEGKTNEVKRISRLPFRDIVLKSNGRKELSLEAITTIKKFTSFIKRTPMVFSGGRYVCPGTIAKNPTSSSTRMCTIIADRPCPLYYSSTRAPLRASSVDPLGIPGRDGGHGEVLVHLDPTGPQIPEIYKSKVVYAGCEEEGYVTPTHMSFVAIQYREGGDLYHLCGKTWLTSESALDTSRISVVMCEEDMDPWLSILPASVLSKVSEDTRFCDCGECPRLQLQAGNLINVESGEVTGNLTGVRILSAEEDRLWDECNEKVTELHRISNKFPNTMSLATLAGMLRVSEVQAAVVVSMAGDGNNPWAAQACYTGLANVLGAEHTSNSNSCLITKAASLSMCAWELPESTYNLATFRSLYVDRVEGGIVHVFGSVQPSDAEIFRPSKYPNLLVGGYKHVSTVFQE